MIMKEFVLQPVTDGCWSYDEEIIVEGFLAAEAKAKSILDEIYKDYPCDDTYVILGTNAAWQYLDYTILAKDSYGEAHWMRMVRGTYCANSYIRPLYEDEVQELQELRKEVDIDVFDLSDDELKELRKEIIVGSLYFDDYENSFHVNKRDLLDECESYLQWLEVEKIEDTPDNFAMYVKHVA